MNGRSCLFAHYDRQGRIAPHIMHYLAQIRSGGFAVHVALSGMERLHDADALALERIGAVGHLRANRGLDFGGWQHLVERGCTEGADTILLANDSVFGPLQPLAPIFGSMLERDLDVWGMVESNEQRWHLQSWFLCFQAGSFAHPAIRRVMQLPFQDMSKAEIVLHGELGLGAAIEAAGLRCDARWHQPRRRLRALVPGNPMHLDFLSVMRDGRVPFIKVELLRDNPVGIGWIDAWRNTVEASSIFPVSWIDRHLGDGGRFKPPLAARDPNRILKLRLLYAAISRDQPQAMRSLIRMPGRP